MSLFSFVTDINVYFEITTPPPPPPSFIFTYPFIKFNKYLRPSRLFWHLRLLGT